MKLSDFDYNLPKELIAQYPLKNRDEARLLVLNRAKNTIEHRIFKDVADYFKKGDLLVLNDTKVVPARLCGRRKTGGKTEVFLLKDKGEGVFEALLKPGRLKLGEEIIFDHASVKCRIASKNEVIFDTKESKKIYNLGQTPLPPYIKREPEEDDQENYQTIYAKNPGAVASPTAGLHFTESLLKKINQCGITTAYLTLHVGIGTFKPVKAEEIIEHKMDSEEFNIPVEVISKVCQAKKENSRVIAVGTTSLRTLEANAEIFDIRHTTYDIRNGSTNLFIYPGYHCQIADCLITNFHLPRTTLFMLVCAFAGTDLIKRAYQEAVDTKYRFYSYGDAMLII